MIAKDISDLKDQSFKSIVPKSCSDYEDYFVLDNKTLAEKIYCDSSKSNIYIPVMPNKPSGR